MKSIGGSPSNVAVAAARLGLRSAVVTAVGADPLGDYTVAKLAALGVETQYVAVREGGRTPVVLVVAGGPGRADDHVPARSRMRPTPRSTRTRSTTTRSPPARVLWTSGATLAAGTTARTAMRWLEQRARRPHTVLDLDLRPSLWSDPAEATAAAARAIELSSVVIGNRTECAMALGSSEPHAAADALLARGVTTAVVKMGADGVLLATPEERVVIDPVPVTARCGSGAGDAFGGALAAGLVNGWSLARTGRLANAAGALVTSRLTCADAMPTLAELEAFLAGAERTSTVVTTGG